MAESIMVHLAKEAGLPLHINSAATSREEIGNPPHPGTKRKLSEQGIPLVPHRAVQLRREDYDSYDLLVGMDSANKRNMLRILDGDSQKKVHCLLDFTSSPRDIADPWYSGDFDLTYCDVSEGCSALLAHLLSNNWRKGK